MFFEGVNLSTTGAALGAPVTGSFGSTRRPLKPSGTLKARAYVVWMNIFSVE